MGGFVILRVLVNIMADKRSRDYYVSLEYDWYFCAVCNKKSRSTKHLSRHLRSPLHQERALVASQKGESAVLFPVPNVITRAKCEYVPPPPHSKQASAPAANAVSVEADVRLHESPSADSIPDVDHQLPLSEDDDAPKLADLVEWRPDWGAEEVEPERCLHWEVNDDDSGVDNQEFATEQVQNVFDQAVRL